MTGIGKLLVFVNLFVSVGLMAWAVSAYANRVDWLDRTTEDGKVNGQITELKAEIGRLSKAVADANAGYAAKKYALGVAEDRTVGRRLAFATRIDSARNGKFRVQLTLDKGLFGEGVMYDETKEGGDVLGPDNKPLRGLKTLQDEFAAESRTIQLLIDGKGVLAEDQWQQIASGQTGLPQVFELLADLGASDLRRLHDVASDLIARDETATGKQKVVRGNLQDEALYLAEKRINWQAELQTLKRREKQLMTRLAEPAPTGR